MSEQTITTLKLLLVATWIFAAASFLGGDAFIFRAGRLVFVATLAAQS